VASRAVGYGIGQLDPGDRSLTVSQPGVAVPPDKLAATDKAVRAQLARLSPTPPRAQVLFQPIADTGGQVFALAGRRRLRDRGTHHRRPGAGRVQRPATARVGWW